ncbi:hypothetical protein B566_EDAN002016 [Ephemera danica]|nr:hypothetical protein B566_EDAN002016 [Ephemera danica]
MTLSDTNVIDDNSVEMEDGVQPHPNPLAFEEDQEPDLSDCEFSSNTHIPFQFLRDFLQTTDIQTGSVYRGKECISGGSNQKFLTCNFNIDGSPISKDGKTSVTPIYLMLNELHFKSRGKNVILAGLWYGKVKPRIDIFLKPFTMQMDDLRTKGFSVTCNGESILYKVICLCCVVDSVARPPLQGIKAVNGYYCCSWCQIKGEYVDETNVKYPFVIPDPPLRNEINCKACCESLQSGENDKDALLGITTASPLINLTSFSMVWGFCPDFPHMIPLGIVRRMLECWLRDVGKPYYIGTGKQLERDPVPLTMRRVMKSKELENFLLYFSVPVLQGYLPDQYFKHWKLLVEGVSIFLQDVITPTEINTAELSLLEYVCKVEKYYGKFEMTYNVHQLLHLAESVRRFGPIWSHTSYPFESALGTLKKLLKTSKGVPQQIVRNIEMNRATTLIVSNYDISEPVFDMCNVIQDYRLVRASVT